MSLFLSLSLSRSYPFSLFDIYKVHFICSTVRSACVFTHTHTHTPTGLFFPFFFPFPSHFHFGYLLYHQLSIKFFAWNHMRNPPSFDSIYHNQFQIKYYLRWCFWCSTFHACHRVFCCFFFCFTYAYRLVDMYIHGESMK